MIKKKKIKILKNTKFYIFAPAKTSTGGPECLHELAFQIKKIFKLKVFMVYLPLNTDRPVHKNYLHFNLNHSNYVEDNEKNILIIPEQFSFLLYSLQYKKRKLFGGLVWIIILDLNLEKIITSTLDL